MTGGQKSPRRPRYAGTHPRRFSERYKELDPNRYAAEVEHILDTGKTPAGSHRPIMVAEVLACLRPVPGEIAVDCTLGGGGHAAAILDSIRPGGRLIGLDVDPIELPKTEARLRACGIADDALLIRQGNFAGIDRVLGELGIPGADIVLADLGVSSMQLDNPARGFTYKEPGPLDLRMNPLRGEPAHALIGRLTEAQLSRMLSEHADEPHADLIASLLKRKPIATTQALDRLVRTGVAAAHPRLGKPELKMSVRRTLQALRIAVNDEFSALEALLRALPRVLNPGGRVAILTFHSGEDRRVKKAFQAGHRAGVYAQIAKDVIRSSMAET
ncbi:MAG TPA: 16S rRNA (cytosine(1402)-N(4))-methyltransferase RsmH, partial [Vicinamibacterales bacterium]|nr:16S rRNA (cytosine(1402)-N(4))-methyltransferase RsmH [Vicinamibacterales bacterium]